MSVSSKSGIFAYDGYLDGAIRGGSHSGETDAKAIEVAIRGGYILKTGVDTLGFGFRLAYYLVLPFQRTAMMVRSYVREGSNPEMVTTAGPTSP